MRTFPSPSSPGGPLYQTEFVGVSPMNTGRVGHSATTMLNGKVLIVGGSNNLGTSFYNTAEIYDPSTRSFTLLANLMVSARSYHTATLLNSGKVLIAGGGNSTGLLNSAELYDPVTNAFASTAGNMSTSRYQHTASLLQNGTVLVVGGSAAGAMVNNSADLYDPIADSFTATLHLMTSRRTGQAASLLQNGSVLITGGQNGAFVNLDTGEVYEPIAQTFTSVSNTMSVPRSHHTSILLDDGTVLVAGGPDSLPLVDLYSPGGNLFGQTGDEIVSRTYESSALLSNGQVVTMGGVIVSDGISAQADLYSPNQGTFASTNTIMSTPRWSFPVAVLLDGTILVPGGAATAGGAAMNSAELFILNQVAPIPTNSTNVEVTGPNYGSLVVTVRPVNYGLLGSYRITGASATMAAGIAGGSEIFQARWTDQANLALIWGVTLGGYTGGITVFTAGFGNLNLTMARSFTAAGTGGSAITPTGNNQKLRTTMAASLMNDIRVSTTAALGAGTKSLDSQPIGQITWSLGTVSVVTYVRPTSLFGDMKIGGNLSPIVLDQNEGIVARITTAAAGSWRFNIDMAWSEVSSY